MEKKKKGESLIEEIIVVLKSKVVFIANNADTEH